VYVFGTEPFHTAVCHKLNCQPALSPLSLEGTVTHASHDLLHPSAHPTSMCCSDPRCRQSKVCPCLASSADAQSSTVLPAKDSPKLDDLSVLQSPQLAHLDTLSLYACRNLTNLGPIAALPRLRTLMLDRCSWSSLACLDTQAWKSCTLGKAQDSDGTGMNEPFDM